MNIIIFVNIMKISTLILVLNIGTSAQLSVVINENMKDFISKEMLSYPVLNLAPYFNNCWLIVAASLTGAKPFSSCSN